jgi:hypothetical protein
MNIFIAAIFIVANLWEQPRFTITNEWIRKMWYLYIMEFYSVLKNYEILSLSQVQKTKACMFYFIYGI